MFEIELVDQSSGQNHRIAVTALPRKGDAIVLKGEKHSVSYEVEQIVFEESLIAGVWEAYVYIVS